MTSSRQTQSDEQRWSVGDNAAPDGDYETEGAHKEKYTRPNGRNAHETVAVENTARGGSPMMNALQGIAFATKDEKAPCTEERQKHPIDAVWRKEERGQHQNDSDYASHDMPPFCEQADNTRSPKPGVQIHVALSKTGHVGRALGVCDLPGRVSQSYPAIPPVATEAAE